MHPGQIIILNGAPRSGKSSIVAVIQETFDGPWMNLGVDVFKERVMPARYTPGIGLRPGGERPDLEALISAMYAAMYGSIAEHSRRGLNVVVDVGHHDGYSTPRHILQNCARLLGSLPVLFVSVRCPINIIMQRRKAAQSEDSADYDVGNDAEPVPQPVLLWQREVHKPGIYDLEIDTSLFTPQQCATAIQQRLTEGPTPDAFQQLAKLGRA